MQGWLISSTVFLWEILSEFVQDFSCVSLECVKKSALLLCICFALQGWFSPMDTPEKILTPQTSSKGLQKVSEGYSAFED